MGNKKQSADISIYIKLCRILGFKVRSIDYKNETINVYSGSGLTKYTLNQLIEMASEKTSIYGSNIEATIAF